MDIYGKESKTPKIPYLMQGLWVSFSHMWQE